MIRWFGEAIDRRRRSRWWDVDRKEATAETADPGAGEIEMPMRTRMKEIAFFTWLWPIEFENDVIVTIKDEGQAAVVIQVSLVVFSPASGECDVLRSRVVVLSW